METRASSVNLNPVHGDVAIHDSDDVANVSSVVIGNTETVLAAQAFNRPIGPIGTAAPQAQPPSAPAPAAPARAPPAAPGLSSSTAGPLDLQPARHGPDSSDPGSAW